MAYTNEVTKYKGYKIVNQFDGCCASNWHIYHKGKEICKIPQLNTGIYNDPKRKKKGYNQAIKIINGLTATS